MRALILAIAVTSAVAAPGGDAPIAVTRAVGDPPSTTSVSPGLAAARRTRFLRGKVGDEEFCPTDPDEGRDQLDDMCDGGHECFWSCPWEDDCDKWQEDCDKEEVWCRDCETACGDRCDDVLPACRLRDPLGTDVADAVKEETDELENFGFGDHPCAASHCVTQIPQTSGDTGAAVEGEPNKDGCAAKVAAWCGDDATSCSAKGCSEYMRNMRHEFRKWAMDAPTEGCPFGDYDPSPCDEDACKGPHMDGFHTYAQGEAGTSGRDIVGWMVEGLVAACAPEASRRRLDGTERSPEPRRLDDCADAEGVLDGFSVVDGDGVRADLTCAVVGAGAWCGSADLPVDAAALCPYTCDPRCGNPDADGNRPAYDIYRDKAHECAAHLVEFCEKFEVGDSYPRACAPPIFCDCMGQGIADCPCDNAGCVAYLNAASCDRYRCRDFQGEVVAAIQAAGGVQPRDDHWVRKRVAKDASAFGAAGADWTIPSAAALYEDSDTACPPELYEHVYDCVVAGAAYGNAGDNFMSSSGLHVSVCGDGLQTWGEQCDDGAYGGADGCVGCEVAADKFFCARPGAPCDFCYRGEDGERGDDAGCAFCRKRAPGFHGAFPELESPCRPDGACTTSVTDFASARACDDEVEVWCDAVAASGGFDPGCDGYEPKALTYSVPRVANNCSASRVDVALETSRFERASVLVVECVFADEHGVHDDSTPLVWSSHPLCSMDEGAKAALDPGVRAKLEAMLVAGGRDACDFVEMERVDLRETYERADPAIAQGTRGVWRRPAAKLRVRGPEDGPDFDEEGLCDHAREEGVYDLVTLPPCEDPFVAATRLAAMSLRWAAAVDGNDELAVFADLDVDAPVFACAGTRRNVYSGALYLGVSRSNGELEHCYGDACDETAENVGAAMAAGDLLVHFGDADGARLWQQGCVDNNCKYPVEPCRGIPVEPRTPAKPSAARFTAKMRTLIDGVKNLTGVATYAGFASQAFVVEAIASSGGVRDARALVDDVLETTVVTETLYDQREYCPFDHDAEHDEWSTDPCCNHDLRRSQCCPLRDVSGAATTVVDGVDAAAERTFCANASVAERLPHIQRSLAESQRCSARLASQSGSKRDFDEFWRFQDTCTRTVVEGLYEDCTDDGACPCSYSTCVTKSADHRACMTDPADVVKCEAECYRKGMDPLALRYLYDAWGVDYASGGDAAFDDAFKDRVGEDKCINEWGTDELHDYGTPQTVEVCDSTCQMAHACESWQYNNAWVRQACEDTCYNPGDPGGCECRDSVELRDEETCAAAGGTYLDDECRFAAVELGGTLPTGSLPCDSLKACEEAIRLPCEDEAACVAVPGREGFDGTWLNPTWLDGTCCIGYASSDADGASCTFKPPGAEESRLFEDETCCKGAGMNWRADGAGGGRCCYGSFDPARDNECIEDAWLDCDPSGKCDSDACDACRTYEQETCCPMTDLEVDRTGCLGEVACNRRAEGGRVADADCDEETYPGGWCGECWSPTECDAVSRPRMCLMVIEDEEAEEDVDTGRRLADKAAQCQALGGEWKGYSWDSGHPERCHFDFDGSEVGGDYPGDAAGDAAAYWSCVKAITKSDVKFARDPLLAEAEKYSHAPSVSWYSIEADAGCYSAPTGSDECGEGSHFLSDYGDGNGYCRLNIDVEGYACAAGSIDVPHQILFEPGRFRTEAECGEGKCEGLRWLDGGCCQEGGYTRDECADAGDKGYRHCSRRCYGCRHKDGVEDPNDVCERTETKDACVANGDCQWDRDKDCADEASCLAAGECDDWGETTRRVCKDAGWAYGDTCWVHNDGETYKDDEGNYVTGDIECAECEEEPGVCVERFQDDGSCADGDEAHHSYGCRVYGVATETGCDGAGRAWLEPAETEAACVSRTGCRIESEYGLSAKDATECAACGGELVPRFAWSSGAWSGPASRDLRWFERTELAPVYSLQKRSSTRRLRAELNVPIMRAFVQRKMVQLFLKYSMWTEVVLDLLCRCGSGAEAACADRGVSGADAIAATATGFCDSLAPLDLGCATSVMNKTCAAAGGGRRLGSGSGAVALTVTAVSAGGVAGVRKLDGDGCASDTRTVDALAVVNDLGVVVGELVGDGEAIDAGGADLGGLKHCLGVAKEINTNVEIFPRPGLARRDARGAFVEFLPADASSTRSDICATLATEGTYFPVNYAAADRVGDACVSAKACSGRGACAVAAGGGTTCRCYCGYSGADCERGCPNHCSGSGECGADGACACGAARAGADCALTLCTLGADGTPCSGHGTCQDDGACDCDGGYGPLSDGTDCGDLIFGSKGGAPISGASGFTAADTPGGEVYDGALNSAFSFQQTSTPDPAPNPAPNPAPEGGAGTCADNTKKDSCKDAGCTWDGKSSPKCQPKAPKCKKLKSEDECEANKKTCEWKKDKCKDKKCKKLKTKDECKANKKRCKWKKDKCKDKVKCKKLETEDECKANKKTCKWKGDKCKDK